MIEIILVGRGGEGAKSAGQIIALAAGKKKFVQAFSEFGPERTGAPTKAFVRISDKEIRTVEPIIKADYILLLDPTIDISGISLKKGGQIIENSEKGVPATKISEKFLGKNKPNTALLGAFARISGMNKNDAIIAIKELFGRKISKEMLAKNILAFDEGYFFKKSKIFSPNSLNICV